MTTGRRREVSCLALTFFYDWLESREIPRRRLQEDLPYPPEHLDNRLEWIDYATFLEIERRLAALFPGEPDLFFRVGSTFPATRGLGFTRVLARSVLSPWQVYRQIPKIVPRFLFPFVDIEFRRETASLLHGRYSFHPGFEPSEAFLETVRGILSGAPVAMGAPPATVRVASREGLCIEFEIGLVRWLGPVEAIRAFWSRVTSVLRTRARNLGDAALEIESANLLLQEKLEELMVAKGELDRRVRDLSTLNLLAAAVGAELDPDRLVRTVARLLGEHLAERPTPVAVVLVEPDAGGDQPPECLIGGSACLSAALEDRLQQMLDPDTSLHPSICAGAEEIFDLGRIKLRALPLRGGDAVLGALLIEASAIASREAEFLGSLCTQVGMALDNARSYQVIRDLRDTLELKVTQRTAQLEEARGHLEDTVQRLEKADQAQREFFANVSHELKTPLTLILAPLDEVEEEISKAGLEGAAGTIANIHRNAAQLRRLVEELLEISRLDDGRVSLRRTLVDVGDLVGRVVDSLRPLADRRRLSLTIDLPAEPLAAVLDPRLIRRVVHNLVGNAIKYVGDEDSIRVEVLARGDEVRLVVADTGPGIPAEHVERVFERFHRVPQEEGRRRVKGSGIGLSMARDLVQLHGGTIQLESDLGRGARFEVILPKGSVEPGASGVSTVDDLDEEDTIIALEAEITTLHAASRPAPAAPTEELRGRKRVLVVEDNPEMRAFIERILCEHYTVITAEDGLDGLEKARTLLPDLVLSDVTMPRLDGFSMCRQLKADPLTLGIPVLLVSARQSSAAREGLEAGADDFVQKPFSAPELRARIDAQLRLRSLTLALVQAEKQSQLGTMAAGIAHEVLNPVNAILNAARPLRKMVEKAMAGADPKQSARVEALLHAVEHSGERIQKVVEAVLRLARGQGAESPPRPADLAEQVRGVLQILEHRSPPGVRIDCIDRIDGPVLCHPELIDQVVMNLVSNSMDALLESGGTTIRVSLLRQGDQAVIRIEDDGPGIPVGDRETIFNPFFTTKPPGKGTGLGLSISREIAQIHGGTLAIRDSSLYGHGPGVAFELSLPGGAESRKEHPDEPGREPQRASA